MQSTLFESRFQLLVVGYVSDDRHNQHSVFCFDRPQSNVCRNLAAIPAADHEAVPSLAHGSRTGLTAVVARPMSAMDVP